MNKAYMFIQSFMVSRGRKASTHGTGLRSRNAPKEYRRIRPNRISNRIRSCWWMDSLRKKQYFSEPAAVCNSMQCNQSVGVSRQMGFSEHGGTISQMSSNPTEPVQVMSFWG